MEDKNKRPIKRTTCRPSLVYQMLVDGIALYMTAFFAYCVEYMHITKDLALVLKEPERIDKTILFGVGLDSVELTMAVVVLVFVAVYMYWSRQSVLQTISDFRWLLLQRKKSIKVNKPDCMVDGGDGWLVEKIKGKDVYLIACFAYDGTLTMVDREKNFVAFRAGAHVE